MTLLTPSSLAFMHHLAAFTLVCALAIEFVLLRGQLSLQTVRQLQRADMLYGMSAMAVLAIGFVRVLYFEKGAAYYFHNAFFHAKVTLFIIAALLSIYPTFKLLMWRKTTQQNQLPNISAKEVNLMRTLINGEIVCIVGLIICAAYMADGLGSIA